MEQPKEEQRKEVTTTTSPKPTEFVPYVIDKPVEKKVDPPVEKKVDTPVTTSPVPQRTSVPQQTTTTSVPQQTTPQPQPHPFEVKLQQLEEMGFQNKPRNIELMVKYGGDMMQVVRDLLA